MNQTDIHCSVWGGRGSVPACTAKARRWRALLHASQEATRMAPLPSPTCLLAHNCQQQLGEKGVNRAPLARKPPPPPLPQLAGWFLGGRGRARSMLRGAPLPPHLNPLTNAAKSYSVGLLGSAFYHSENWDWGEGASSDAQIWPSPPL